MSKLLVLETKLPNPIGWVRMESDGESLTAMHFLDGKPDGRGARKDSCKVFDIACKALEDYCAGRTPKRMPQLSVDATDFQHRIYGELVKVPAGSTTNYGELADLAGSPNAARAVGQAMGANQVPVFIPCHRVLASGGKLGGFSGGLDRKRALLKHEGANWRE